MKGCIVNSNSSSLPMMEEWRIRNDAEVMLHDSFGRGVGSSVGMKNGEMAERSITTMISDTGASNLA